jgi:hypothetical protein
MGGTVCPQKQHIKGSAVCPQNGEYSVSTEWGVQCVHRMGSTVRPQKQHIKGTASLAAREGEHVFAKVWKQHCALQNVC